MRQILKTLFADKSRNITSLLLALLMAVANVFIQTIYYNESFHKISKSQDGAPIVFLQVVGLTIALFILFSIIFAYGGRFCKWLAKFNPLKRLSMSWKKSDILICAGIIMLFWIPWLIIYFPGSTPYDPIAQIYQTHGSGALRPEIYEATTWGWISNTHPILHTLILGGFFELGAAFGSQNLGLFMYTLFQSLFRAVCFGVVCCYLRRIKVPKVFCLLTLAFYALYPGVSTSSVIVFKDHLFSPVYVVYFLLIIELVLTKGAALSSRKYAIGLALSALFMALLKHPGIYIVLVCGVWLLIRYRKQWKALLAPIIVPALTIWVLLPMVVFPALNVIPGGVQEMMGPFLQQTARVINEHPKDISSEDKEIIDKVVPYRIMATKYLSYTSDIIKGNYRQDVSREDQLAYFGLWFRQLTQYPEEYFEAFFCIEDVFIVPLAGWDIFDNLPASDHLAIIDVVGHNNLLPNNHTREVAEDLNFGSIEELYPAKNFMRQAFLYNITIPVIGFFYSVACYTFYIPLLAFAVIMLNKRKYLLVFIPVLLTFLVLMISPMAMTRYALPMLEATPLLLGVAILAWLNTDKPIADCQKASAQKANTKLTPSDSTDSPIW